LKYGVVGEQKSIVCPGCKHNTFFLQECNYLVNEKVSLSLIDDEHHITSHDIDTIDIKRIEHTNNFVCSLCGRSYFIFANEHGKEVLKEGE